MLGVVGDFLHRLIGGRQIDAEETLGVNHRAFAAQLIPDRKRIFGPTRIGVIEIMHPIGDRGMFGHHAAGIGHLANSFCLIRSNQMERPDFNTGLFPSPYSSCTSIAISGQLVWASHALSSWPEGTEPSPTSWAFPNSSSSNNSGASDLQRACP